MRCLPLLLPLLLLPACTAPDNPDALTVAMPVAALHAQPGAQQALVRKLDKGAVITDLGQVSTFESAIQLGDSLYQAPWIKVRHQEQEGWIWAGALRAPGNADQWLLAKRSACYFGNAAEDQRQRWLQRYAQLPDEAAFDLGWHEVLALRDNMMRQLDQRPQHGDIRPDDNYAWMQALLPGFVYQFPKGAAYPYLYADYNYWHKIAQQSKGPQDDALLQLYLRCFPQDGIESPFPCWVFQLSQNHSASLLGSGKHLEILQAITAAEQSAPLFQSEYKAIKNQVMDDILGKDRSYWLEKEKVIQELQAILKTQPACLDGYDLQGIEKRIPMFEKPAAFGIKTNLRAGE